MEPLISQTEPPAFPSSCLERGTVAPPALHSSERAQWQEEGTEAFAVPEHKTFLPWGKCGFVVQENFCDLAFYPLEFLIENQKAIHRIVLRKGDEVLILD